MSDNRIIVGKNKYKLLKANSVKQSMLKNILAKSEPIVLDKNEEYKNICQEFNVERISSIDQDRFSTSSDIRLSGKLGGDIRIDPRESRGIRIGGTSSRI